MNRLLTFALIGLAVASCKKDTSPPVSCTAPNYFPMKVGNYWIYEYVETDTFGNETYTGRWDSIAVSGKMELFGNDYWVLVGNRHPTLQEPDTMERWRDSAGHFTWLEGMMMIAPVSSPDTQYSVVYVDVNGPGSHYEESRYLTPGTQPVTVPVGTFDVVSHVDFKRATDSLDQVFFYRNNQTHFADGIGRIKWNTDVPQNGNLQSREARLVRYHLES